MKVFETREDFKDMPTGQYKVSNLTNHFLVRVFDGSRIMRSDRLMKTVDWFDQMNAVFGRMPIITLIEE